VRRSKDGERFVVWWVDVEVVPVMISMMNFCALGPPSSGWQRMIGRAVGGYAVALLPQFNIILDLNLFQRSS
jgi:hypothetical protein